ncbi:hypothetical protein J6590_073555 [Homalodisca vitripennis]|nr:hypothetical protein J6590_073555 [Homalodisca vitripennis]
MAAEKLNYVSSGVVKRELNVTEHRARARRVQLMRYELRRFALLKASNRAFHLSISMLAKAGSNKHVKAADASQLRIMFVAPGLCKHNFKVVVLANASVDIPFDEGDGDHSIHEQNFNLVRNKPSKTYVTTAQ